MTLPNVMVGSAAEGGLPAKVAPEPAVIRRPSRRNLPDRSMIAGRLAEN
jgi:hypothetical protein